MKHNCVICGKQELDKDTIGINKKLLGTDIENFYCMECLAEYLECTVDELLDKIEEFKANAAALADVLQEVSAPEEDSEA